MPTTTSALFGSAISAAIFSASSLVAPARAANELCGQTITQSITVPADQTCTGDGLIVTGDDVTVDLGGFTLSGDRGADDDGIDVSGAVRASIRNGTIRNFGVGVTTHESAPNVLKLSQVTLRDNVDAGMRAVIIVATNGLLVG
jgi:hypothetical protein